MMLLLAETEIGANRSLLPDGRDAAGWHGALFAEIAHHLSAAHAAVLAVPVAEAGRVRWETQATEAIRYPDLPATDREALMRAVGSILSDIRRLAEGGAAPAVARCWPALREIPELGMLFAADGRPVLAGWGAVPRAVAGPRRLLAPADDGRAWDPPPRTPWQLYGAAAAMIAAFAVLSFILLARFGPLVAPGAQCAAPPDAAAKAEADARHGALAAELARLVQEEGQRRLQCKLPVATAPPALPHDRWERHDLSMLEGCWNRISNMTVRQEPSGIVRPVATWRICFDSAGNGTQTITLVDGSSCTGPLRATFRDELMVTLADRCLGPGFDRGFVRSEQDCSRVSDAEAQCVGTNLEGPDAGRKSESRFRR
jgi:hypothetical protein